jgi:hemolysin activation/secretion protein
MQKISILLTLLGSITYAAEQAELTPVLKGVVVVDDSSQVRNTGLDKIEEIQFDGLDAGSELKEELIPFRTVNADYQPAAQTGVADMNLIVTDKKNWKIGTGVDNTGTNPIGPIRIFGKLDVNDFIFTNHTLNIQATTADHFKELQSYTVQYVAPLPWNDTVRVFGSYSDTAPVRADFPQKHRENYQASGRYAVPHSFDTNPWIDSMTVEAGFDFKGMNTNVLFEDDAAPVNKTLAYVGQFAANITALRNQNDGKLSAGLDLIGSPAQMLPHQTAADFNNLREGATPQYFYSRLSLSLDQKLPANWKMFVQGRSQFSASNLIPAEQFALGGYNTVRGYDEKAVNGDNALCGNFEIRAPEFTVAGIWFPKTADSVTLLGFVDAGYAWFREAVEATPVSQTLLGFGPGVRYNVSSYFTSRLDVGFPLLDVEKSSSKPHVHFNAILSY